MAALPAYAELQFSGFSQQDTSIIERSDVERGPAKTRRTATDPMVTDNGTLFFRTRAAIAAFRAWFYSATGANAGAAWFDWTDPRTDTVRQIRFVSMGALTPLAGKFAIAQQPVVFEYLETVEQIAADGPRTYDFLAGMTGWAYYDLGNSSQGTVVPYTGPEGSGLLLTRPAGSTIEIGARQTQWNTGGYAIPAYPQQRRRIKATITRKSGVDGGNVGLYCNYVDASGGYGSGHFAPSPAVSSVTPAAIDVVAVIPAGIVGINLEVYWGTGSANGSVAVTGIELTTP